MAADNKTIGRFILDGILPAPRGVPQIEVSFDIDANGILNVRAKDQGTGREQKITITASSGLSKEEIERIAREAELHAEEDRRKQEEVEAKNAADSLAYQAERTLREYQEKIPQDLRSQVEGKIADVRSSLQSGDISRIRQTTNELSEAMQRIGMHIYQQSPGPQAAPGGPTGERGPSDRPDEGTVEGEFREV